MTAFHLQEVLSNAQYTPSQPRLPAQVMIVTETIVNVEDGSKDEMERGAAGELSCSGKAR